ncbi:MAG: branched-chain amino acid ABC transporter permease [bacterium]|jgi:branched-chain amino acid transport system permease protein|nr:branched-chain amino acid ABC transporter permease [bacterium]
MSDGMLRKYWPGLLIAAAGFAFPLLVPIPYARLVFSLIFIKILLCLSLRQTLLTGLLNLSGVAFMAIGAYFSAIVGTTYGYSFWIVLPLSGLLCAAIGCLFSFPLLRLKGAYFFIGTVCIAAVVETFFSNFFVELFGGVPGFSPIDKPRIAAFGSAFTFNSHLSFYYLSYVVLLISLAVFYRLEHSRYGRYWMAMNYADRLVETVGVDLFRYKMLNVSIASFFCGIAGSLFGTLVGLITPHDFNLGFMFLLVMFTVVGGTDYFWGPVVGVIVISLVAEVLRDFGQYETLGYGFILVLALLFMPKGICGLAEGIFRSFRKERVDSIPSP